MPRRKTQKEFEKEIQNILGDTYTVLGEYINNHTKIKIHHSTCGNSFLKLPKDALRGSGCPFCCGARPALYDEKWVKDNTPLPYHYISGFTGMANKCYFYCDDCQTTFQQSPTKLINCGIYGCNCCPTKKKTHEEFLYELGDDCLKEYEVIDRYVNFDTKIRVRHKTCDTIFSITPDKFLGRYDKQYCPTCYYKKSLGEVCISSFLTKNKIAYVKNFSFTELKNKMFDFYLPEHNICIEYDGEQHFRPIQYFGGEEHFIDGQRRDKEKNKYCIDNKISLFRIPYWDKRNIKQILQEILIDKKIGTIDKYLVTQ